MKRRGAATAWARQVRRGVNALTRAATAASASAWGRALQAAPTQRPPAHGGPGWTRGVAVGTAGARRYQLYRPPGVQARERLPLMVMLHGCGQDAAGFAASARMNRVALRERFLVLYVEQDRLANANGCWHWFDTDNGRAFGEAALILNAIDQVSLLQPVDTTRVAIAGLSAGASMAALLATRYPARFCAVVMHSGIPPGAAHSALSAVGAMRGRRTSAGPPADTAAHAVPWPPLLVIHGDADGVVSPRNGEAAAAAWAQAAGATAAPARRVQRGRRHAMSITDFKRGGRIAATLVQIERLGHAWSGGAAGQAFSDAQGPDASRMAWAFAARAFQRSD